jgi:hypothetical protein
MPLLDVFSTAMWFFGRVLRWRSGPAGATLTGCFGGDRICDNSLDTCTGDCQARDMTGALWDRGAPWRCWQ